MPPSAPPLRSRPARWFELLVPKEELYGAMTSLAARGAVELEGRGEEQSPELPDRLTPAALTPELAVRLKVYHRHRESFGSYWPDPVEPGPVGGAEVKELLDSALRSIDAWRSAAEPVVRELQALKKSRHDLELLTDLFHQVPANSLEPQLFHKSDGVVEGGLFVLPPETAIHVKPAWELLAAPLEGLRNWFLVAAGRAGEMQLLEEAVVSQKGRRMKLPPWLESLDDDYLDHLREERVTCLVEEEVLRDRLGEIAAEVDLARRLGELDRLEWFATRVPEVEAGRNFSLVTGWIGNGREGLEQALAPAEVRALGAVVEPPDGKEPPLVLDNPPWAKPFELFPRLLGMPGRTEADPSRILALLTPFLFGYMFGDLGQGLVLAVIGYLIEKKGFAAGRLLTIAGCSAAVFGLLFGSIFSIEHVIPALWLHPLAHPMILLGVPLGLGVLIILGGLGLNGMQARWRGEWSHWLAHDAPVILVYLGVLAGFLHESLFWLCAVGVGWLFYGLVKEGKGAGHVAAGLGHLPEALMQLLVNTLSFARVGAFALAHAGLSLAVVGLSEIPEGAFAAGVILVVGNVIIIILEGLVVSIQTTRLMLFEFFVRFLKGDGRVFRPLAPPNSHDIG